MLEFGSHLRKAREDAGMTLDRVSELTRVRPGLLAALEADRFSDLPEKVFTRGFVRSYCLAVSLEERETMEAFERCWEANRGVQAPKPSSTSGSTTRPAAFNPVYVILLLVSVLIFGLALAVQKSGSPRASHDKGMTSIQKTDTTSGTSKSLSDFKKGRR
jgi:cytoskeletal protein RodZ